MTVKSEEVFTLLPGDKLTTQELRRGDRIRKEIEICLVGWDAQGVEFMEQTKTVVLSRHGAGIVSTHKLAAEQELIIVQQGNNKETEIRVVGQIGCEGDSYTYGVAFLDPVVDFWGVEFPSASQVEIFCRRKVLHCSICGSCAVADLGTLESDIYDIHGGILRSCKRCNGSTLWKQSPGDVPDASTAHEPVLASPELTASTVPCENRRKHVRIKVCFKASVRSYGLDDEIVACENVSRGGLCFRSRRRYYEMASIEVAAPFSPGSLCIPVPARIVYVQELPEGKAFRYGVQYLALRKDSLS